MQTVKDGDKDLEVVELKRRHLKRVHSEDASSDDWVCAVNDSLGLGKRLKRPKGATRDGSEDENYDDEHGAGSSVPRKPAAKRKAARSLGDQPVPKRRAGPAPKLAPEEARAEVRNVTPSMQQRAIKAAQVVLSEAELMLTKATTQDGIKCLSEAQVRGVQRKLLKKIDAKMVSVLAYRQAIS